eukprot:1851270-Amphidinium_carterae.1
MASRMQNYKCTLSQKRQLVYTSVRFASCQPTSCRFHLETGRHTHTHCDKCWVNSLNPKSPGSGVPLRVSLGRLLKSRPQRVVLELSTLGEPDFLVEVIRRDFSRVAEVACILATANPALHAKLWQGSAVYKEQLEAASVIVTRDAAAEDSELSSWASQCNPAKQ